MGAGAKSADAERLGELTVGPRSRGDLDDMCCNPQNLEFMSVRRASMLTISVSSAAVNFAPAIATTNEVCATRKSCSSVAPSNRCDENARSSSAEMICTVPGGLAAGVAALLVGGILS